MRLQVAIPVKLGAADDEATLEVVAATIAAKASVWTEPVYAGEQDTAAGPCHVFRTDAQPRSTATTANVAPTLLPAKVL